MSAIAFTPDTAASYCARAAIASASALAARITSPAARAVRSRSVSASVPTATVLIAKSEAVGG